jgi:hypothetical protein
VLIKKLYKNNNYLNKKIINDSLKVNVKIKKLKKIEYQELEEKLKFLENLENLKKRFKIKSSEPIDS